MLAAWFVSIQSRIVAVRALERPVPLPLGGYTEVSTIGRQRGLQTASRVHVPICVGVRIRARARDSACMREMQEVICVRCDTCLDAACVSKPTNWWENPIVSIWHSSWFRLRGSIGGIVGKSADKVYYDKPLSRPSTYRGDFEAGHSSGRAEENQRDVPHTRAKGKSDALDDGGTLADMRFPIFHRFDPHYAQP